FTDSVRDLVIEGDGQLESGLIAGQEFGFNALLGYVNGVKLGRVVMSDLTLDGNYSGVGGGTLGAVTANQPALCAMGWPYTTSVAAAGYNGLYHRFIGVRFYRPSGFTFQGCSGIELLGCLFESCGQPDIGVHQDNLGSAQGDAIVIGCTWKDSSGNYA